MRSQRPNIVGLVLCFLAAGCSGSSRPARKTVTSADEMVSLRIPETWAAKHEAGSSPSIYQEERADAPRFLINMIGMKSPKPIDKDSPKELLRKYVVEASIPDGQNLPFQEL